VIVRVDPESAVPVYEQIRVQLLTLIASGTLSPGTRLPTIRQLATDLGLAKGTVSKAYDALLRAGLITSRGRHGTVVAPGPPALDAPDVAGRLREAALQLALTARQLGVPADELHRSLDQALASLGSSAA